MAAIEPLERVHFHDVAGGKNASAITFWRDRALIAADELAKPLKQNVVQVFEESGNDWRVGANGTIVLDERPNASEMDLEGIATDGDTVYVLGSHSWRRKLHIEDNYVANRLAATNSPEAQPARDVLLRFTLSSDGSPSHVERTSLRSYLEVTEPFQSFSLTASKENGVDAEGLAFWKGSLFVGFRGPVIRGNLTPILKCSFGQPIQNPELFFVNLGGRGVRDLAALKKHLLILAGPMGDGPGHFQLYLWDGRDGVPGGGAPTSPADPGIILIGDVPIPTDAAGRPESGAKAEGLAVFEKASGEHHWEVLIVFDGLKNGHAMKYRVEKPQ